MAINAMQSANHPASFIGIDQEGNTCILHTTGNDASHLILRGGKSGPNYYEENVEEAEEAMLEAGLTPSVVIDCSHANSGKKQVRQQRVLHSLVDQVTRGQGAITGFMLESNLKEGCQEIPEETAELRYGVSVTDACIGWEETRRIVAEAHEKLSKVRV
jgi:3-deoxy-7-phosphoheptulonate synthase